MTTAEHFASLDEKGEITLITEGYPPHELLDNQIALTEQEFHLLKAIRGDLQKAKRLIQSIERKIKNVQHSA